MVTVFSSQRDQLWYYAENLIKKEHETRSCAGEEEEHGNRIQIKYSQLVSNLSCFGEILTRMYEERKLSQGEFEYMHKLQSTPIRANEELLNVISRKSRDAYECFLALLMTTNQPHLYQLLASSHDNLQDDSAHQDFIRRNFTWLSERLDTEHELIFLLYQRKVLTFSEKEQVACKKGHFERNIFLLGILSRKSKENFEKFLTALEETNQSHIVHKFNPLNGLRSRTLPNRGLNRNTESSLQKPFPPPKPRTESTIQPLRKLTLRHYQRSDVMNQNSKVFAESPKSCPKMKANRLERKFKSLIECRLQTEISIKVIALRQRTFRKSENILEICIMRILQNNRQLRSDLTNKESENNRNLEQLGRMTSEYTAATLSGELLKVELRFLKDELKSQNNLNLQNSDQQKCLAEKLNKWEVEVSSLKMKCNSLKDEGRLKETSIKQLESQLNSSESQNQTLEKRLLELSQQLSLAEQEKENKATEVWSLKETDERSWLVKKEMQESKTTHDVGLPTEENHSSKDTEKQSLLNEENSKERETQAEESVLILFEIEKVYDTHKEAQEEIVKELKPSSENEEQLEIGKRPGIANETGSHIQDVDDPEHINFEILESDNTFMQPTMSGKPRINVFIIPESMEKIPTRETLALRNNYQFLVENIDSGRLINVLHEHNYITDEERDNLRNQPGRFYRNEELLHWMRTIEFKRDKGQRVLQCFREGMQDFIADILSKGGVVVKSTLSSKLVSKFPNNLSKKSSRELVAELKEKEEFVALKLNQSQAKPSFGNGLKTISELFEDEIEIAPYSLREENGIVVWFWCHTQSSLLRLQSMYVSGLLLERATTLFKLLSVTRPSMSSTSDSLVPHTITISADEFLKTMAIIDYKKDPTLFIAIRTKAAETSQARIFGMTILDDELFVASERSSCVEVYNLNSLQFKRSFSIDNLEEPQDIVSCSMREFLYILDCGGRYAEKTRVMKILRVDANGNFKKILWQGDDWGRLSVTHEFNVILAVKDKLLEMTSDGQLIREIKLAVTSIWHAVKLTSGYYLVSYGKPGGLCIVDNEGKMMICHENYYRELGYTGIVPVKLALDKAGSVFVVDANGGRVFLLSPTLEFQREVLSTKHRLQNPRRILLDESNCRLLVGENASHGSIGQISVFDIRVTDISRERTVQ